MDMLQVISSLKAIFDERLTCSDASEKILAIIKADLDFLDEDIYNPSYSTIT